MAGDGTVYIDVSLNVSDADKQIALLKQKLKELESAQRMTNPVNTGAEQRLDTTAHTVTQEKLVNEEMAEQRSQLNKIAELETMAGKIIHGMMTSAHQANSSIQEMSNVLQQASLLLQNMSVAMQKISAASESASKSTGSRVSSMQKAINALSSDVSKMQSSLQNGFSTGTSVLKFKALLDTSRSDVEKLRKELQALGSQKFPTEDFAFLENEIKKAGDNLASLLDRSDKMKSLGIKSNSREFQSLSYDIQKTREQLSEYAIEREQLLNSGKAYTSGAETEQYRQMSELLSQAEAKLARNSSLINEEAIEQAQLNIQVAQEALAHAQTNEERAAAISQIKAAQQELRAIVDTVAGSAKNSSGALNDAANNSKNLKGGLDDAANSASNLPPALQAASSMLDKFSKRILGLVKRIFIFTMITSALRSLRTYISDVIKVNEKARSSLAQLKAAFLTLGAPIMQVVVPALTVVLQVLTKIVTMIASLVSTLLGSSLKNSIASAQALEKECDALKATGKEAKKATSQLAAFDEINQLEDPDDDSGSSGGTDSDAIQPDFEGLISDSLDAIVELFAGVALLALGAILAFTGVNVPLGIALMAIGAALITDAVALNWETLCTELQGRLGIIFAILSAALLVIGAILAFSGVNTVLGISLMAIGALGLVTVAAANWEAISQLLQGPLGGVLAVLGAALLVIGAILFFSGVNIPLGLGLIAVGALALGSAIAANWESIKELLAGPIGIAMIVLGAALLVIGAVLFFSSVNWPLGLALMAAGAVALGTSLAVNWDTVSQLLQGPLRTAFVLVSTALLVLGTILLFSGANVPLGIGLLVAGALGLAVTIAANWETVQKTLQGPLGTTAQIVGAASLVLGAIFIFSGASIPLGLGLLVLGAGTLAAGVAANWDTADNLLRGPIGAVTGIVSTALLALGALLTFSGANVPIGLGLMLLGATGLAATIAANWETIQTQLQGPIGVITGIVGGALLVLGAILVFTGAAIPLGLGMLAVGGASLAATMAVNWETIQTQLQGPIGTVTGIVGGALLALGAILLFSGVAIPLGLGMLVVGAATLATTMAANWETIQTQLQGPIGTVTGIVGGALLALGAILLFTGVAIPLGLGMLVVGGASLAATLAANWSVISSQVGGTISSISAVVGAALLVLGIILLLTGAGIPLGLGLIAAGAASLAVVIAPNWDFIKEAIKGAYDDMKNWWDTTASKFFTLDYWMDLGKNMLSGLFNGLSGIGKKVSDWGGSIITGVKNFFGIHSPSTEFAEIGNYMMSGLENGISEETSKTVDLFNKMLDQIIKSCTSATNKMKDAFRNFLSFLRSDFSSTWNDIWSRMLQTAINSISRVCSSINDLNRQLSSIQRDVTVNVKTVKTTIETPSTPGKISAPNISIPIANVPALAKGAVIPPNRKFLAVLGDQTSGMNYEVPDKTLRNLIREEMGGTEEILQQILQAIREGKILKVDKVALGRVAADGINNLTRASGKSVLVI